MAVLSSDTIPTSGSTVPNVYLKTTVSVPLKSNPAGIRTISSEPSKDGVTASFARLTCSRVAQFFLDASHALHAVLFDISVPDREYLENVMSHQYCARQHTVYSRRHLLQTRERTHGWGAPSHVQGVVHPISVIETTKNEVDGGVARRTLQHLDCHTTQTLGVYHAVFKRSKVSIHWIAHCSLWERH